MFVAIFSIIFGFWIWIGGIILGIIPVILLGAVMMGFGVVAIGHLDNNGGSW